MISRFRHFKNEINKYPLIIKDSSGNIQTEEELKKSWIEELNLDLIEGETLEDRKKFIHLKNG